MFMRLMSAHCLMEAHVLAGWRVWFVNADRKNEEKHAEEAKNLAELVRVALIAVCSACTAGRMLTFRVLA
jgi:hypothetical protein